MCDHKFLYPFVVTSFSFGETKLWVWVSYGMVVNRFASYIPANSLDLSTTL